jgi:hypothetical protein
MVTSAPPSEDEILALLEHPSRKTWRLFTEFLDLHVEQAQQGEQLSSWQGRLDGWPARWRAMPGRWMHRWLLGEIPPWLPVVRSLDLTIFSGTIRTIRFPWAQSRGRSLHQLQIFELYDEEFGDEGASAWRDCSALAHIEQLSLATGITDKGAISLANFPHIQRLRSLNLARNQITADGLHALFAFRSWETLEVLHLGKNPCGERAMRTLSNATFPSLHTLDLDGCLLTGSAVESLCHAPWLAHIRELNLSNNPIGGVGCSALSSCVNLRNLKKLYLHNCQLTDVDVQGLLTNHPATKITNFTLSENQLSLDSVKQIAKKQHFSYLEELDICHNSFADWEAENVLNASEFTNNIKRVCV